MRQHFEGKHNAEIHFLFRPIIIARRLKDYSISVSITSSTVSAT